MIDIILLEIPTAAITSVARIGIAIAVGFGAYYFYKKRFLRRNNAQ